jgi:hypothetical protein
MKDQIIKSAEMMGFDEDLYMVLDNMEKILQNTKEQVDHP